MRVRISVILLAAATAPAFAQTSFTYQGRLSENGQAANGAYDLDFRLIDLANAGNEVSQSCRVGVPVLDGLFSTAIDLGPISRDYTYSVRVRARRSTGLGCDDQTGFTTLQPDQILGATPRAIHAMNASSLSSPDGSPATALQVGDEGTLIAYGNLQVNGGIGLGTFSPTGRLDMRSNDSGFFRFMGTSEDIQFNGGTDGAFGFFNVGAGSGRTDFINGGAVRLSIGNNGRVGINTNTPGKTLTVAGDMELGTGAGDYRHFRIGGGNSSGFLYGSFPALGDGIHMGYNAYSSPTGATVIANAGGGSSRVSTGYGYIALATGDIGLAPTNRLVVNVNGNVGINAANPTFRLDVGGTVRCTSVTQTSSARFKDAIVPLDAGLDELMRLKPVSFVWNDRAPDDACGKHDLGFIAEDVAKVLPDAVALDADGQAAGIDYTRVSVLAVKAIQQQQAQIESQRVEIETLNARLEKLERTLAGVADR